MIVPLAVPECVHCGFCLPACPTYEVLGTEMDNPRGRLYLMRALEEGRIGPTEPVVRHLDLCLGCRACETECPSGVPYGQHLEKARARLHGARSRPAGERLLEAAVLRAVALPPAVQRVGVALLAACARVLPGKRDRSLGSAEVRRQPRVSGRRASGVASAAREQTGTPGGGGESAEGRNVMRPGPKAAKLRGRLAAVARLLAAVPPRAASLPGVTPPRGERRLRVGILEGCVARWVFGSVNEAAARLLAASGCEVIAPRGQGCCGALHAHSGDREGARRLARANIETFERAGGLDAIVVTAAGCGSAMKEYAGLFDGDPQWSGRARRFASKVRDALELLAETGLPGRLREIRASVAYHDACHLAHAQGIRSQPRELLGRIPGLTLVPLAEADRCCGSAGIYNLLHPEVAEKILASKLERVRASGAEIVAAANPGCLLQIAAGARAAGLKLRVAHPLEILDEATRPD